MVSTIPGSGFAPRSDQGLPKALRVYLIRPSKYDDEGYVVQHWRGIVPSNTLACLAGLTEDVKRRGALGDLAVHLRLFDETVERVPIDSIGRRAAQERDTRTIACLVGVQSCMFARAADLALQLRAWGIDVLIGGFHVSGAMAGASPPPPEIQALLEAGVTVVLGEVEERWESILRDAVHGRLSPIYDLLADKPALAHAPMPTINGRYLKRFLLWETATIDCSRGCPFNCSFCTIINVQGRTIRARSVDAVAEIVRRNYAEHRISRYFFTDDNFARNPNARPILELLARLRSHERIPIEIMIQADTAAYRIPGFIDLAQAAGCYAVFIGMESLNPQNLAAAGKAQNQADEFPAMIAAWRRAGILTHVGYIIGFPHDTPQSVRADLRRLREEVQPDLASFFMLTPLPGSRDYHQMRQTGQWVHPDLNRYDGQHANLRHPHLSESQWQALYQEAWESFYSFDNMKQILQRVHPRLYWPVLTDFLWYKWSSVYEKGHPMLTGVFRLKDRLLRRPGWAVDSPWRHFKLRAREIATQLRDFSRLFLEMEDLWLQTRPWTPVEYQIVETGRRLREGASQWLKHEALEALYEQFRASRRVAGRRWAWFMSRWSVLSTHGLRSRRRLAASWNSILARSGLRRWLGLNPFWALVNTLREIRVGLSFACAMVAQA